MGVGSMKIGDESPSVILLDGKIIGWASSTLVKKIAETLRYYKVSKLNKVPLDLEIGLVPKSNRGQYPGLFLASTPARMVRPVKYLANEKEDLIGPFEQVN